MAFLSRFFSRPERAPLPELADLLEARGVPSPWPGLEALSGEFRHMNGPEREAWADALAALHRAGQGLPDPWIDAQYDLLPEVVPTWKGERDGFYFKPCLDGLSERVLACGREMPEPWLALWEVEVADVMERALDQLREKSKDVAFERLPSGVYRSAYGDGLDSARILLPEIWKDLFPGQNTFVAVPARDVLLVAPQVLLPKLVEAINQALAAAGPNRLMATIFQWVDQKLLPANLQDPHPIAQLQREFRQGDLVEAYGVQGQSLDPSLGAAPAPGLLHTQQGRSLSFALWQEGAPVLLPDTDIVGFVSAQGAPLGLYWRQTLPRISRLHGEVIEFWGPRRLRIEAFPTEEELDRLERFATGEQMAQIFKPSPSPSRPAAPPKPQAPSAASASALSSSPVPEHLRGLTLGVQDDE